jgi:hypothetical protein
MKNIYWKEKGQLDFLFNLKSLTEKNSEDRKQVTCTFDSQVTNIFFTRRKIRIYYFIKITTY